MGASFLGTNPGRVMSFVHGLACPTGPKLEHGDDARRYARDFAVPAFQGALGWRGNVLTTRSGISTYSVTASQIPQLANPQLEKHIVRSWFASKPDGIFLGTKGSYAQQRTSSQANRIGRGLGCHRAPGFLDASAISDHRGREGGV